MEQGQCRVCFQDISSKHQKHIQEHVKLTEKKIKEEVKVLEYDLKKEEKHSKDLEEKLESLKEVEKE